jgi:hypothetical protein
MQSGSVTIIGVKARPGLGTVMGPLKGSPRGTIQDWVESVKVTISRNECLLW